MLSELEERRYWRIRRDIERVEALGCFILATISASVAAQLFWLVFGVLSVFNLWTWIERRRADA